MKAKVGKIITEKEVIEIQLEDNIDIAILLSMLSLVNKEEKLYDFAVNVKKELTELTEDSTIWLTENTVANKLHALETSLENELY